MYDIISKLQDLFFFLSRMFVFRWTKLGLDELERRSNYYSILKHFGKVSSAQALRHSRSQSPEWQQTSTNEIVWIESWVLHAVPQV